MRHARQRPPVGSAPGHLAARPDAPPLQLRWITYDSDHFSEEAVDVDALSEHLSNLPPSRVGWLDVIGIEDSAGLEKIGAAFALHPLLLEDIALSGQPPKAEAYDNGSFLIGRFPRETPTGPEVEQLSFFLGERVLLTFQEREGDAFEPVRQRLRHKRGRIRERTHDYLAYALLDAAIDAMLPVVEEVGHEVARLEAGELGSANSALPEHLHAQRRYLRYLKRLAFPLRTAVGTLIRDPEHNAFTADTRTFLRDSLDHLDEVVAMTDGLYEDCTHLLELHLSMLTQRMNEVMRFLTLVSTIFIPLSFVVGVYGMNFEYMPELSLRYGYFVVLGGLASIMVSLLLFFRRRGWLQRPQRARANASATPTGNT